MKIGFDSEKYLKEQSEFILERVNHYDKLYLEFGGKLMGDLHAARVLPGYDKDAKIKLLERLRDKLEIVICIFAEDIEKNKIRGDYGITYDMDVLRLIDDLRDRNLLVNSVVLTRYHGQPAATMFIEKLKRRGIRVYEHQATKGYPFDVNVIVSEEGYGKNSYIETTKPIVVVTAPGPGSGKLATCLSQLYHEAQRGNTAGYSKFETFPVWNVPLKHPLNVAYEAATVDLKDVNMIDNYHMESYGEVAVNYNRDIEAFPLLKRIIEKITGEPSIYKSPTDMGVNRVGYGIIDDEIVKEASCQEIIRRYFKTACDYKKGQVDYETFERARLLMEDMNLKPQDRKVTTFAHKAAEELCARHGKQKDELYYRAMALELHDGQIITGKNSDVMSAGAALLMNALKTLAGIPDEMHLISPLILEPILKLKREHLSCKNPKLNCEELMTTLSICAVTNPTAMACMDEIENLRGLRAHSTTILPQAEEVFFGKLGIDTTSEPVYPTNNLYYNL